jgi:hypothetical protein
VNGHKVIVLKFGSSVLSSPNDLTSVVDECYRHVRDSKRVLAVVSAFVPTSTRKWTGTFHLRNPDLPLFAGSIERAEKWTGRAA